MLDPDPRLALARLGEPATVDVAQTYDPRSGDVVTLLGVRLRFSQRTRLKFLPSQAARDLVVGIGEVLLEIGGLPEVLELPMGSPFVDSRVEHRPVPCAELQSFGDAFEVRLDFPGLREPRAARVDLLELAIGRVFREFLPARPVEALDARNQALAAWLVRQGKAYSGRQGGQK